MIVRHEDAHDDARRRRRNDLGVGAHFVARARATTTTTRDDAGRVIAVDAHESVVAIAARRRARAVEWRARVRRDGLGWFAMGLVRATSPVISRRHVHALAPRVDELRPRARGVPARPLPRVRRE
jgi:hypothetical protein